MGTSAAAVHVASSSLPSEPSSTEEERRAERPGTFRVCHDFSSLAEAWQVQPKSGSVQVVRRPSTSAWGAASRTGQRNRGEE
jgi:hypothetical protein